METEIIPSQADLAFYLNRLIQESVATLPDDEVVRLATERNYRLLHEKAVRLAKESVTHFVKMVKQFDIENTNFHDYAFI